MKGGPLQERLTQRNETFRETGGRSNVPNYGYDPSGPSPFASFNSPHPFGPELMRALSESEALIDSLSPGVRASYDGALLAQEDARKREQDREEAEYAAFIEGRLRRLNAVRPSKK